MKYVLILLLAILIISCGNEDQELDLGALEEGQAKYINFKGTPIFIYASSKFDKERLSRLSNHVVAKSNILEYENSYFYIVKATPSGGGCLLKFVPADGKHWYGGYIDPCKDSNYDVLGRAIKNAKYTLNNYASSKDSLESLRYLEKSNGVLKIWPAIEQVDLMNKLTNR